MRVKRGIVGFYDDRNNMVARRQYGTDVSLKWLINYRTTALNKKGKTVAYYQIDPHSNPDKVRDNGRNLYQ
jgi:hypothetical protein